MLVVSLQEELVCVVDEIIISSSVIIGKSSLRSREDRLGGIVRNKGNGL